MLRLFLLILVLILNACLYEAEDKELSSAVKKDNISAWSGTYHGVLPCADCNRIELEIVLFEDFRYRMKTEKIGSIQFPSQVVDGKFKWRLDGDGLIQLDEKSDNMVFFVGSDGRLEMRSNDGKSYPNYKGEVCHLNKL